MTAAIVKLRTVAQQLIPCYCPFDRNEKAVVIMEGDFIRQCLCINQRVRTLPLPHNFGFIARLPFNTVS